MFFKPLGHRVHESSVLLCVCLKCVLRDALLTLVSDEDANSVVNVLQRAVLTSLMSRKLAKHWCVLVLKEVHVVERVVSTIAPVQLEWVDDDVLGLELLVDICRKSCILAVGNIGWLYSLPVILQYHCLTNAFIQVSIVNSLQQVGRLLQLWLPRLLDDAQQVVMDVLQVVLRGLNDLRKVVDWISSDERLGDHVVKSLACFVQIDLFEQFKSSFVDHIDFIVDFLVVGNFAVDYACVAEDAVVVDLRLVDLCVGQVSVQIVELVEIERVTLV